MGRNQLSSETTKSLNTFVSISEVIEDIYESMAETELLYGRDSNEYRKLSENLSICLETEEQILSSLSVFNIDLMNDYLLGLDCERAINKLNFLVSNQSSFNDKKISIDDVFGEIYLSNFFNVLSSDFDDAKKKKVREILVREKYDILIDSPSLERKILNSFLDIDDLLIYDDEFVSLYFDISLSRYKILKNSFFVNISIDIMNELLSSENKDLDDLRYRVVMERRLRSCFVELSDNNIEYLYSYYQDKSNDSLGAKVISNAFYRSNKDVLGNGKTKRKSIDS